MFNDFFIPLLVVALSEIGDKTQFAILALSSKHHHDKALISGIFIAFFITTLLAIFFGSLISNIIPANTINLVSGTIFLVIGLATILYEPDKKTNLKKFHHFFTTSFVLVLLSEIGDKSQIATGLFSASFNQILVFSGAILGILFVSLGTIYLGRLIAKNLKQKKVSYISGIIFILVGLTYFIKFFI